MTRHATSDAFYASRELLEQIRPEYIRHANDCDTHCGQACSCKALTLQACAAIVAETDPRAEVLRG